MATPVSNPLAAGRPAAEAYTLDTAILLPTPRVFEDLHQKPLSATDQIEPLTPIGGVPLLLRTVLTLQRAGITHFVILTEGDEGSLKRLLTDDPRVAAHVRWMPLRECPLGDPRTWETLRQEIHGACLLVGAHAVFSRALIEELRRQTERDGGRHALLPQFSAQDGGSEEGADMIIVPASLLGGEAWRSTRMAWGGPLQKMRAHAAAGGHLKPVLIDAPASQWSQTVRTVSDIPDVERRLLQARKGSYDGFIDTYFNRKVAQGLTRLFVKAGWSPNAVTILSLLIGFTSAALFARGTYVAGIVGALLFQLSAIIDCCDGEVARLTFRESRFGRQLDLIGDNIVHMTLFGALGWAGYAVGGGPLCLILSALAVLGNGLSLWFVTRMTERSERRAWTSPIQAARSEFIIKNMVSRDFSILVLLFAVLNLMGVFLWFVAIGSNLFWIAIAWTARSPSIRA